MCGLGQNEGEKRVVFGQSRLGSSIRVAGLFANDDERTARREGGGFVWAKVPKALQIHIETAWR